MSEHCLPTSSCVRALQDLFPSDNGKRYREIRTFIWVQGTRQKTSLASEDQKEL